MKIVKFNVTKFFNIIFNQIISSGKSFLLAFIIARYFDKESFGIYSFAIIGLNNFLSILTNLVYEPLTILKNGIKTDFNKVIVFLYRQQWFYSILLVLFLVILPFCKRDITFVHVFFISTFYIMSQFHEFFKRVQLANLHTGKALFYDIAIFVSQLLILTIFFYSKRFDLNGILCALSLGALPTILYGLFTYPVVFDSSRIVLKDVLKKKYLEFVKPSLMFFIVGFSTGQLNNFAIFLFLGSSNLANCEAVRLTILPLHITILAIGSILLPYFSNCIAVLDQQKMVNRFRYVFSAAAVFFVLCAISILICGPIVLKLFYSNKYISQSYLIPIYTFIYVFDGMNCVLINYIKALGLISVGVKYRFFIALSNISLLIPAMNLFKEFGALVLMLVSSVSLTLMFYRILKIRKLI